MNAALYSKNLSMKNVFIISLVVLCFILQEPIAFVVAIVVLLVYSIQIDCRTISVSGVLFPLIFFLFLFPAFLALEHGVNPYFYYVMILVVFFSAKKMAQDPADSLLKSYQIFFYVYVICVLFLYYIHRDAAEPFGEILKGVSTNGIPSYLIVLQVVLSLVAYTATGKLPLFSTLCTLLIAILGIGRGSILAACMIVVFSVFFNIFLSIKQHHYGVFAIYLFGIVVLGIVGILHIDLVYQFLDGKTKILHGLYDPYRAAIFSQYLDKINLVSFFTGAGYEGTDVEVLYENNPHIAFIRTHAYLGVGGLLLVFFSPLLLLIMPGKIMKKFIFFTFIAILFFRALSEPILFPTLLDFFFCFILWFYYFDEKNKSVNPKILAQNRVA